MSTYISHAWILLAWGIACTWVAVITIFLRGIIRQRTLPGIGPEAVSLELPRLSVVLAARNEAACIETCIRSLFAQNYPGLEVIAVNDRSTDETPAILDRLATQFQGRLHVLHINSLPAGWFGKPHALTQGLQAAKGSLVCFTDADCEFLQPNGIRTAVADFSRRRLDVMTIMPKYRMMSLRESVAVPCCSEAVLLWLHPERAEDPTWDEAFANGSFFLVNRESFEKLGGWTAVRTQICEDLQFMRLAKRSGQRISVINADGIYQTASYETLRDSWNGWSRIFKGVLSPRQLSLTLVRMCVLFVLPLVWVIGGTWLAITTGSCAELTQGAGLALTIAFALRLILDVAMFRISRAPLYAIPLASIGRLFVMAAVGRALLSHAGLVSTHWRGASFVAGKMVTPRPAKAGVRIPEIPAAPVGVRHRAVS